MLRDKAKEQKYPVYKKYDFNNEDERIKAILKALKGLETKKIYELSHETLLFPLFKTISFHL